jgi:hypothetical protein
VVFCAFRFELERQSLAILQVQQTKELATHAAVEEISKKIVQKVACFQPTKERSPNDHHSPRIHHNFTTKTPPKNAHFLKPPSKTPAKKHKKAPATAGAFFLAKSKKIRR